MFVSPHVFNALNFIFHGNPRVWDGKMLKKQ